MSLQGGDGRNQIITAGDGVFVTSNGGDTFVYPITTATAGMYIEYIYDLGTTSWN